MARGKTLQSLLQDFRAEIRTSQNAAHNVNVRETHVRLLQRVQETLWESADWPHLRVRRLMDLQAGQRYYASDDDIHIDRLESIDVMYGGDWCVVTPGISNEHYAAWNSDLDQRSWPAERWQVYEDDEFEVWPIPAQNADATSLEGKLRLTGIRNLSPLVADDDRADLDNRLIVLFAAAETLAASGADDAPLKLRQAEKRLNDLTSNQSKIKQFKFGCAQPDTWKPKGPPRVHYRTGS